MCITDIGDGRSECGDESESAHVEDEESGREQDR
jgi:hypothetical protein